MHHSFCRLAASSEGGWICVAACTVAREAYVKGLEDSVAAYKARDAQMEKWRVEYETWIEELEGPTPQELLERISKLESAFKALVNASDAVARLQPAASLGSRPQAEPWSCFYDAIRASTALLEDEYA